MQNRLIARISHSLRTPITAVLGISDVMLHDTSLPAHIEEAFRRIQNSGKVMLGVANDIVSLQNMGDGTKPSSASPYDIAALVSEITQLHLIHLGSRRIEYKVEISPTIPSVLVGDEPRVKQVLDNLLANAFKFTETGTIKLTADWQETDDTRGNLIFDLMDTGLGEINKNDKFGISIIEKTAAYLNATVKIQNEPGMGMRVRVIIPQTKTQNDEILGAEATQSLSRFQGVKMSEQAIEPVPMPYGKALVVDDVEACLFLVKGMLGFYEIQADLASNGGEVIEKIINGNTYDIIFMDHLMPELDGVAATKALREMGYTAPIVALTANVFGDKDEYLSAGFDAYISKPINPEEFDTVLHKYVRDVQPRHVLDAVSNRETEQSQAKENSLLIHADVAEKLRQDFARKQRNVYTDITVALGNGETETAQWHLDAIKNMAGMIGEPILTKVASDTTTAISNGDIPTHLLEMLNQELTRVLAGIPDESERPQMPLTYAETQTLFDTVQELLETDSAECTFLIEKLQIISGSEELVKNIENFDFPQALSSLETLRKNSTPS